MNNIQKFCSSKENIRKVIRSLQTDCDECPAQKDCIGKNKLCEFAFAEWAAREAK